jgi:hypothetical protein
MSITSKVPVSNREVKMAEHRQLSEVQHYALQAARKKLLEAQIEQRQVVLAVMRELGIEERDFNNWDFTNDFRSIERKGAPN